MRSREQMRWLGAYWKPFVGAVVLWGFLKVASKIVKDRRLDAIMPPGPPGLPLLGNILQISGLQWMQFAKWSEQYGPIFSLNMAGQRVIVLNDFETTADLLDRRSNIYSDRPKSVMASRVLTRGLAMPMVDYGDRYRKMRRATHEGFGEKACESYEPALENRAAFLLSHMLAKPADWEKHFSRFSASAVLGTVYGWPAVDQTADSVVERITSYFNMLSTCQVPGAYLVEFIPSMLYLPPWMAKWKRDGQRWFHVAQKMFEEFYDDVGAKMLDCADEPCFVKTLISGEDKFKLSRHESVWLAGFMFGAGSDATAATLSMFLLAMVLYPEVQGRAQTEIDRIVGRDRLPTFADRARMPYMEALVREVLRWRPAGPMGLPRKTSKDDWYKDRYIPQGTVIIYNVWAMHRDPRHFPDYDVFRPERFLDSGGELTDDIPNTHHQGHTSFGTGRRICPGKDLATRSLYIAAVNILWAFEVGVVSDADGCPKLPSSADFVDEGLVVRPASFECTLTVRTPEVRDIVASRICHESP